MEPFSTSNISSATGGTTWTAQPQTTFTPSTSSSIKTRRRVKIANRSSASMTRPTFLSSCVLMLSTDSPCCPYAPLILFSPLLYVSTSYYLAESCFYRGNSDIISSHFKQKYSGMSPCFLDRGVLEK